ncbi:2OG-Fe(II) oxygenase [Aetokthonos hydrillicola Thurmond2011]|jgi:hypothetical protein|uniref:2OG-Fe(II) oxygenase n=1 Tax=Aetokthonos hydrillicola Thurmond2011 TaxID=2712845 RepID=A0AAP5M7R0_9CYAN|nr:2OG-Fe(II) oxygenase [Aetokthonos hydrillicola]MBO3462460.1 2OG-Fe(II) oxygenase [Aetokthonos hydrillicola CCALA 1050]MBW4589846.1 2OG-Fe(II) oxygenase [Aetokthonos hydrillicola CCALA 1050]MDR9898416.1 2OG-Fe(II) oxygenase [Aetokthonos hydrillicola Thurmond2011]
MKTIVQKVCNRILRKYEKIPFVRNSAEIDYQLALKTHASNLPVLSIGDLNLVNAINREGIVMTSLASLSIASTPKMLENAEKLIDKIPKSISANKNEYVVHATSEQIIEYPEIFIWGLEQRLLNIVENYIGLPVAYHGSYVRRDLANQVQERSRLWHIDKEDRKILKIIVYLNDVDDNGGPFQYLPKSLTTKAIDSLKYSYGYVTDKTMESLIHPSHWKSCLGPSGTVIFADTGNIFHRGKIPVTSDRLTIFFDYSSRQAKVQFSYQPFLPQEDLHLLTSNVTEYQKKSVFWRESLSE